MPWAHFARLQMRVFFSELLHRLPPVSLAGEPTRLTSNFINGLTHLPIGWGCRVTSTDRTAPTLGG